jgi:transcription initiation factor TFIIIB Brf1 subunit/transcription initiation factor TFIIB
MVISTQAANDRLIAAAPELLSCCEEELEAIERIIPFVSNLGLPEEVEERLGRLRAAIAKAKGVSP